ncbi:hypothetical protein MASR1M48_17050 [Lactococcus petauri]
MKKKSKSDEIAYAFGAFLALVLILGVVYLAVVFGKKLTYVLFYEDQVHKTIIEKVNPSCLKQE